MNTNNTAQVTSNIVDAVREQLTECQNLLERLRQLREEAKKSALPIDYVEISIAILEDFITYAYADLVQGEYERALEGSYALFELGKTAVGELEVLLAGQSGSISVPRYQTSKIHIDGASFYAQTKHSGSGALEQRPVFFTGYGHFTQVRNDVEKFPRYGINLIQVEFGPRSVFPDENTVSNAEVEAFLHVLDRAEQNNVAVNLLISPHYFPDWALRKYPHLKKCGGGFLKFCVDAPESRDIIQRFINSVIPQIANHSALHSICLTNEPIYRKSDGCIYTQTAWRDWLEKTHATVEQLNRLHNAQHKDFSEVPIPQEPLQPNPLYYDWTIFNRERFAEWHRWMADQIHGFAPKLPVHAKIMIWHPFERDKVMWGVDPELFGELSDINGNDCWKWYPHHTESDWQNEWLTENMAYDLQRSVADKPIFNSENHLIRDRDLEDIPPVHIRNALWQGAIHGQSATTIWAWERSFDPESDFSGSIMHRPSCVAMVGTTHLDLMRLSREVAAIQNLRAEIAILYSTTSVIYAESYLDVLKRTYTALNFTGVRIRMVTERMIENSQIADYKVIVVPHATHITHAAHTGLQQYIANGGQVITIGADCLTRDAYDQLYSTTDQLDTHAILSPDCSIHEFWEVFEAQIETWHIRRPVRIVDDQDRPVWGVEYLAAFHEDRWLINLTNYTRQAKTVIILTSGYPQIRNLLIDQEVSGNAVELEPLDPILLEIR